MKNEKIQKIINKISEGNFTSSDVGLLLVLLRPIFSKEDEILLDLSNFVNHQEGRTKGESFVYVTKLVTKFLTVLENGGSVLISGPVFRSDDIINRLILVLEKLELQFNNEKIITQKKMIINYLQELIDEVDFLFKNEPQIVRCYIKRNDSTMSFHVELSALVTRLRSLTFSLFD